MALCPQGIPDEKRVFLVFFRLRSGGSDASGIVYGITAQMEVLTLSPINDIEQALTTTNLDSVHTNRP